MGVMVPIEILGSLLVAAVAPPAAFWRGSLWYVAERQFHVAGIVQAVVEAVLGAAIGVCYRELINLKDPDRADEAAAIFDRGLQV
jgi:hypothetical protein